MSAVAEIEAAIAKLTELSAKANPGKWARNVDELNLPGFMYSPRTCAGCGGDWPTDDADADLIVTLHRTIDAQLGILTRAYNMAVTGREVVTVVEMNLARAINGTAS